MTTAPYNYDRRASTDLDDDIDDSLGNEGFVIMVRLGGPASHHMSPVKSKGKLRLFEHKHEAEKAAEKLRKEAPKNTPNQFSYWVEPYEEWKHGR
jgi:hypothetical protein